jgi:hypothetical protein
MGGLAIAVHARMVSCTCTCTWQVHVHDPDMVRERAGG